MYAQNTTEETNERLTDFDSFSIDKRARLLIEDYRDVQPAVEAASKEIACAGQRMATSFLEGGNIIFVGAGTSGRLGVLQHAECPPTFGTEPERVQYLMAGGTDAVFLSGEGAEDSFDKGYAEANQIIKEKDIIIGMSASGTTPYVLGVLAVAKEKRCKTIGVVCNTGTPIAAEAEISIELITGPEYPHGGTRKKAGQAQKMAADVMTTLMNHEIGNIVQGEMVGMKAWLSEKLKKRAVRIVMRLCDIDEQSAKNALESTGYHIKDAIKGIQK